MKLQSHSELVTNIFLAEVSANVVHLSVEIESQDIPHASVDRQIGEREVCSCLRTKGESR